MTLRTRLAIAFFLTALLTGLAVAWFGVTVATRHLNRVEQTLAGAVEAAEASAEQRRRSEVVQAVDRLAAMLEDSIDLDLVMETAGLAGLDILQVIEGDGTILCSLHWPEQVGSRSLLPADRAAGNGGVIRVPGPASEEEAFVAARSLPLPQGSRTLIGGVYRGAAGPPVDFTAGESPRLVRPMLLAGVAFAVLAGLIGILLARLLTRPLEEMTRAMDAVAAGDEDHDYPQPRTDEFGPLVASFSRMRSSLDREQARLQAVERVAAWRETARRVAHEIKNPLVPIRLTMENLLKARSQGAERFDPVFEDGARAVLEEVGRLGRIVDAFSAYARMPRPEIRDTGLDQVLDPVVALFSGEPGLIVERSRQEDPVRIGADPDLLAQAFRNILANCREAMGASGGTIRIETRQEDGSGIVAISDTGPGMSSEVLEKLFDPYFTTRQEGTGLGMAIAHRIVTEHGGTINAGNREGGGALFTVSIPLATP